MDITYVKESRPTDLTEYAVADQISEDPEFVWWLLYTLKKRNIIISKLKKNYWRITHNYGVRLPKNVMEAIHIYQANGNTYWKDAIDKNMKKANIAYKPR